jgi:hypothetical protein
LGSLTCRKIQEDVSTQATGKTVTISGIEQGRQCLVPMVSKKKFNVSRGIQFGLIWSSPESMNFWLCYLAILLQEGYRFVNRLQNKQNVSNIF